MNNLKTGEVITFSRPGKYMVINIYQDKYHRMLAETVNVSDLMNNRSYSIETFDVGNMGTITHIGYNKQAMEKFENETTKGEESS